MYQYICSVLPPSIYPGKPYPKLNRQCQSCFPPLGLISRKWMTQNHAALNLYWEPHVTGIYMNLCSSFRIISAYVAIKLDKTSGRIVNAFSNANTVRIPDPIQLFRLPAISNQTYTSVRSIYGSYMALGTPAGTHHTWSTARASTGSPRFRPRMLSWLSGQVQNIKAQKAEKTEIEIELWSELTINSDYVWLLSDIIRRYEKFKTATPENLRKELGVVHTWCTVCC